MEQKCTDQKTVLKKILDLDAKVQDLKKQYIDGRHQVELKIEFQKSFLIQAGAKYELLKQNYLAKFSERRKLYNEFIELKGNIRVFCRCRPLNKSEIPNGSIVSFGSSPEEVVWHGFYEKSFEFDHVFRPDDNQEAVFAETKPLVTSVLDGYNVCIFSYGQTGTGKTFTMEGNSEHKGVNYRTLEELFRISNERRGMINYELHVSMLEIYNEKIKDLLAENSSNSKPTDTLKIKEAADGTPEVQGLVEVDVFGTKELWKKLKSGHELRSVGSTSANEHSSRSHCLLRLTVVGKDLSTGEGTRSHLWLVDLAGSECIRKTNAEGKRLEESTSINKSLLALDRVFLELKSKSLHISYRDSKLTRILQSSLGGDCKTLMFVHISPSKADSKETRNSLTFAARIREIEKGPANKQLEKHKQKSRRC